MILRSAKVQGMRCFRNQVYVGSFGDGLNMIYAPNETGKSALIEAVSRALFDRYSIGGQVIEALRPWGTSLCPEIELEFEANEQRYRLHKRLLDDATCALEEMKDGTWTLLAERDRADEFVRALMHGDLPGRGPTKLEHRGLARTLWCVQELGGETTYAVSTLVADQLQAAMPGKPRIVAKSDALRERVEELYERHFTRTGRVKKHSSVDQSEGEIRHLEKEEQSAVEAYQIVEQSAEQLTQISQQLARLTEEKKQCEERVEQYRAEVEAIKGLRAEVEAMEKEAKGTQQGHKAAVSDLERYQGAEVLASQQAQELGRIQRRLDEEVSNVEAAQTLLSEARKELNGAEETRKTANEERERGHKVNQALRLCKQQQQLTEQVEKLEDLERQLRDDRHALAALPRPTDKQIAEARQLTQKITQLGAQLEVAGLWAEVKVSKDQGVRLSGGGGTLTKELAAGDSVTYQTGSSLEIELPKVVRIKVTSGAAEPQKLEADLKAAREQLELLLVPFAAQDVDALYSLQANFEARQGALEQIEEEIEGTADPYDEVEEVRAAQAQTKVQLTQLLNQLELSDDDVVDMAETNEEALEQVLRKFQATEERLRRQLENRREHHEKLRERHQKLLSKEASLRSERKEQLTVMNTVLERVGCIDGNALQQRADEVGTRANAMREQLDEKSAELPSPETDPENLVETQQAALEDIGDRERQLLDQRGSARGVIERARSEGRYERLSEIEEKLDTKRKALERVRQNAQAVKLLRQVLTERREEAVSGQLPGLEDAIARMLRHITGRERPVQIGSDLQIQGIASDTDATPRAINDLSAGTREQLDLVARIALGETYARHYGRTMMVLDDALLYTDPLRHDRAKEILKRAAEWLQIFVLTSHPERYRGIVALEYQFDLSELAV